MSPKYYLIAGTMFIAISFSGVVSASQPPAALSIRTASIGTGSEAEEKSTVQKSATHQSQDKLHSILGVSSDEEMYAALYDGKSLAEMATPTGNVDQLIDMQLNELTQQLDARLASGSLTPEVYQAQLAELPGIIANSVHTKMTL
ncbi:hypothetical protein [Gorillibacterium massiliense]|uniref:hypothetical protein n=1 Tax=Gorillibacterium massiliense TaxID=1280390 RepID=UPI0004BB6C14|nr:hypothetical protein [Gorillibacterium massiliense]